MKDGEVEEIDLSKKYFSLQMQRLLSKGIGKGIKMRVFEFDSPAIDARAQNMTGTEDYKPTRTHARRSLVLHGVNALSESCDKSDENDSPVLLPLQRYGKKQKEAVSELTNSVKTKRQELMKFDDKLKRASRSRIKET